MSKPSPASMNAAQPADAAPGLPRVLPRSAPGLAQVCPGSAEARRVAGRSLRRALESSLKRAGYGRLNERVLDTGDAARRATHRRRKGVPCHGGAGRPTLPWLQRRAGGGGRRDAAGSAGHRLAHGRAAAGQEASVLAAGRRRAQRHAGQPDRWIKHRATVWRASRVARDAQSSIYLPTYTYLPIRSATVAICASGRAATTRSTP